MVTDLLAKFDCPWYFLGLLVWIRPVVWGLGLYCGLSSLNAIVPLFFIIL